jgi:hypothetical protein
LAQFGIEIGVNSLLKPEEEALEDEEVDDETNSIINKEEDRINPILQKNDKQQTLVEEQEPPPLPPTRVIHVSKNADPKWYSDAELEQGYIVTGYEMA